MNLPIFHEHDGPEISMSPLIDCVFLLLIFFLVSSMTKVKNRDIPVDLPASEAAVKLRPSDRQSVVGIDAEGRFYWNGQPCTTNFLLEQFRDLCIADPDRRIRIDMDRNTPFGRFAEVMDACQFYNLSNIGISANEQSSAGQETAL
ncbi:MAG: biopolymer transporter ExbD [Lentisphaeria bacterium]|nr:biopolymer transporter ExbD [Lentisphaeria bacterium]